MRVMPYGLSDCTVGLPEWRACVVGKINSGIDLDSEDETVRMDSEVILKKEIARASYLSLQACLLPAPKGTSCVNYARCVSQILQGLKNMQLWLRIPFGTTDDQPKARSSTVVDSWKTWNSFRLLCEHHSQLLIALDIDRQLPPENFENRWLGEPVIAAIIDSDVFLAKNRKRNDSSKCFSKRHQKLITKIFDHSLKVIISGEQDQPVMTMKDPAGDSQTHPFQPHLDLLHHLYEQNKEKHPLSEQERDEIGLRDILQSPFNPIKDYSIALTYSRFDHDAAKYNTYQIAIRQALLDRVPDEMKSEITIVLMIVGAGRGPLVFASLDAATETGRKLKVYALEKNRNAANALDELVKLPKWRGIVTPITCDVLHWTAPEKADILVSDMLGFGDTELYPEIFDRAQSFLKNNGISIPSSYSSFVQPLTASKFYNDAKERDDILNSETPCAVKLHNVAQLAPCQQVFTFDHAKHFDKVSNQLYRKLRFVISNEIRSAMVHGFAGYFDATLYKNTSLGIEPSSATPKLFTWLPMFIPLRTPVRVDGGSTLEVHFWRCCDSTKAWYEWCVTSPSPSPIHNCNGRSYWLKL